MLPNKSSLNINRIIELTYRGKALKLNAKTLYDEVQLRLDCHVRNVAIRVDSSGGADRLLLPLFCENSLVPLEAPVVRKIESELVSAANAARACANEAVPKEGHQCGEQVISALKDNEQVMEMIDSSFRIENAWFIAMSSSGAQEMLQTKVLALMPSESNPVKPQLVAKSLSSLKTLPLYRFCSAEAQSSVNIVTTWVEALASSRQPSLVGVENSFLKEVSDRMCFFMTHFKADDMTTPSLFGHEAIVAKIQEAKMKKDEVSMQTLQEFSVYSWMLSDGDRKSVQDLVKAAVAQPGGSSAASASSSTESNEPAAKVAKKAAKNTESDSMSSTMALFFRKKAQA